MDGAWSSGRLHPLRALGRAQTQMVQAARSEALVAGVSRVRGGGRLYDSLLRLGKRFASGPRLPTAHLALLGSLALAAWLVYACDALVLPQSPLLGGETPKSGLSADLAWWRWVDSWQNPTPGAAQLLVLAVGVIPLAALLGALYLQWPGPAGRRFWRLPPRPERSVCSHWYWGRPSLFGASPFWPCRRLIPTCLVI
jgi:hypothetical protein